MARVLEVCDAVVAYLEANWSGTPPTITRVYVTDFEVASFTGPQVYVFPTAYAQDAAENRGEDVNGYQVSVVFFEKATTPGLPPTAWVDARVDLVESLIYAPLGDHRNPALADVWPEEAAVVSVYDFDFLRQHNLFISECVFRFQELV